MTNYLDEYNKRMTYGNAMGFNSSPLAQTAHMHADRDRQMQQPQTGGVYSGEPIGGLKFGDKGSNAGWGRALLILGAGMALLVGSVFLIETRDGILPIIGMVGAFIGFVLSAFGAVATFLTGLMSFGILIRQKIFWAIAAIAGLSAFVLSTATGIQVFVALMLVWGAVVGGKKLRARIIPASVTDSQ